MEIVITQWALDAYLNLSHRKVFTQEEFNGKIKPDVRLLKEYPTHPKFNNGKFWSPASYANNIIANGFKMK